MSCVGKSSVRSNSAICVNMPTIPIPTTTSPQQGGTSFIGGSDCINQVKTLVSNSTPAVQTSGHNSTPTIPESPHITPNQRNPISKGTCTQSNPVGEGVSIQNNIIGEGNSSSSHAWTLISQLQQGCNLLNFVLILFRSLSKMKLIPMELIGKGVSNDTRDCYFREFKKHFYWDSSIDDSAVKKQWMAKAAQRYRDFISKIKKKGTKPTFVPENVWESWTQLWVDSKTVEKSEQNAKNRRGGGAVVAATHTGGSISIGEHRKRLDKKKRKVHRLQVRDVGPDSTTKG